MREGGLSPEFAAVLSLLDSTAALRRAAEVTHHRLGADLAAGAERVDDDDTVVVRAVVGACTEELNGLVVGPQTGLGGQAAVLRRTVAVEDYCASRGITHDFDEPVRAEGLRAVMAAPVVRAHRLYGVLYAARRTPQPWTDRDRAELLALARQTAVAMEVADSAREMSEVAVYSERQRLAVRLHDSVGSTLFGLRATLTSVEADLPDGPARESLRRAIGQAERATADLRAQSRSLYEAPSGKGLAVAVQGDCRDFSARTGVAAELVVLGDLPRPDGARSDALLRVAREALLNVEKHAHAHSVLVSLYPHEDGVVLAVADDGTGGAAGPDDGRGLGRGGISDAVARVGGRVSFARNEEGGSTVRAWVPTATARPPAGP